MTDFVYLKLQKFSGTDLAIDTIPLKVQSVSVSVDKTVPNISIPFAGLATGESEKIALDLGMATKRLTLTGFIIDTQIKRSHTETGDPATPIALEFTAQEIAQLIASGVDATGLTRYQAFNELLVYMDSKVNENYEDRGKAADSNVTKLGTVIEQIPLTFAARGNAFSKDNTNIVRPTSFPSANSTTGIKGFVSQFSYDLNAETVEISFSMEFTIATVLP
tara:strand:+ start:64 stop:723 length:660 start_codon:yes stop_codon:yes gene_type:complete